MVILVFVDVETNGMSHVSGRVIEVGAIRVENGQVTQTFNKLIDPEVAIPQFISRLTGINQADVTGAPTFSMVADELYDILRGAVFVAHNVRFDYSFIKQEFKRVGKSFSPRQLCTVKLSRALYPDQSSHKLQSLIERHGFAASRRHRAFDDADVLRQFTQHIQQTFPPETIQAAIAKQLKAPALPKGLAPSVVAGLPEEAGVYIFEDAVGRTLYIGKSVNIKKRVQSHFSSDHAAVNEFKITQTIQNVSYQQTNGELEALLLESQMVKELQPLHNKRLRKTKKLLLAIKQLDAEGYITVKLEEAAEINPARHADVLAVFPQRGKARQVFNQVVKDYNLCPKLFGLEKPTAACFLRQLRKCKGACVGLESPNDYNARLLDAFERKRIQAWPYKSPVIVKEHSFSSASESALIIDQWCVIAEVSQAAYCEPVITLREKAFDLDTYKILTSFFSHKLNKLSLKPFPLEQLTALREAA